MRAPHPGCAGGCWLRVRACRLLLAVGGRCDQHLGFVEDVGVLSVGVVIILWCRVCCHVAVDGVDGGVTGGLLPPLILLVVWVEDGGCRFGVSERLRDLWWDGRVWVRLVRVSDFWVVPIGGVSFPCLEMAAYDMGGRDSLPDVGASVGRGSCDHVEV